MPRAPILTAHVLAAIGRDSLTPREIRRRAPAMSRGGLHAILSQQVQRRVVVTAGANPRRYSLAPGLLVPQPPKPVERPSAHAPEFGDWFADPRAGNEWRPEPTAAVAA